MRRTLALIVALGALALPALAQEADFPGVFDEPYTGNVNFEVFPVGGGGRVQHDRGTGEASFSRDADGTIRLNATGSSFENGGIGFEMVFEAPTESGWQGFTEDGMSEITGEGRILSIGLTDDYMHTLWGWADDDALSIALRRTPTGAALDTPEGEYEMVFTFDLAIAATVPDEPAEPAENGAEGGPTSDCAQIITQTRVIANPGGGAMSMIMVPVCVPG